MYRDKTDFATERRHVLKSEISPHIPFVFIGPRYPWSDLWVQVSKTEPPCADLTDLTQALGRITNRSFT